MGIRYDKFERLYKCRLCNTTLTESERFSHLRDIHYVSIDIGFRYLFGENVFVVDYVLARVNSFAGVNSADAYILTNTRVLILKYNSTACLS